MKLDLDQYWGKKVGVVFSGGHYTQGVLAQEKSCGGEYVTLTSLSTFTEFRIALNSIDGIGVLAEGQ